MGAHVCECVQRGSSSAVLSASSWRFHSSFCLAPISPLRLNPSCLPRAQHLLLADCPSNNTPVLLFGHPPRLIPYKNHLSTFPQDWWPLSLMKREFVGLHCLPDSSINDSQDRQIWTWVSPPPANTHREEWSNLNTGLTTRRWPHVCGLWTELPTTRAMWPVPTQGLTWPLRKALNRLKNGGSSLPLSGHWKSDHRWTN